MRRGRLQSALAPLHAAVRAGYARGKRSAFVSRGYDEMSDAAAAGWAAILLVSVAAVLLMGIETSAPAWVIAALFVAATTAEVFPMSVGRVRYVGSDFVLWMALVTIGPTASLLVTVGGIVVDATLHRVPLRLALCNVSTFAATAAFGAAVFLVGGEAGLVEAGGAGLPLAVLLIAWTTATVNLLLLRVGSPILRGLPVREVIARHLVPVLPWQTLTAALAAGAVHAYYTIGHGSILAALLLQGVSQVLLTTIEREQRQRDEVHRAFAARDRFLAEALEAEARERRRVALELHDETLQNLLAARQDLAEGDIAAGDLHLAVAVEEMRGLMARKYEAERSGGDLESRLRELIHLLTSQRSFSFDLHVVPTPSAAQDDLIVAVVRELVVNAIKHSGGSHVRVSIEPCPAGVVLAVEDDGAGFDGGTSGRRVREGHLGLAVVQDRVAAIGGEIHIERPAGGGAVVRAVIPTRRCP